MVVKGLIKKDENKVEEVISQGGEVASDRKLNPQKEWTNFCLRIRKDLVEDIEKCLEDNIGMTKTSWILQAIQEKLRRENT